MQMSEKESESKVKEKRKEKKMRKFLFEDEARVVKESNVRKFGSVKKSSQGTTK